MGYPQHEGFLRPNPAKTLMSHEVVVDRDPSAQSRILSNKIEFSGQPEGYIWCPAVELDCTVD